MSIRKAIQVVKKSMLESEGVVTEAEINDETLVIKFKAAGGMKSAAKMLDAKGIKYKISGKDLEMQGSRELVKAINILGLEKARGAQDAFKKYGKKAESLTEAVDIKKIIAALRDTDWGDDNKAQGKAVQLLRGIAFSDDPLSNKFMKALSDASTKIGNSLLKKSDE